MYLLVIRRVLKIIFDGGTRIVMWQLVAMNVMLIILDITLLTLEFFDLYMIETTFKSLVYSVKLKVQFCVLSQIVRVGTKRKGKSNSESSTMSMDAMRPNTDSEKWASDLVLSRPPESRKRSQQPYTSPIIDGEFEVHGLQRNLPSEWRMSIGYGESALPNLLELQPSRGKSAHSISSFEDLYPGRLG